MRHAQSGLFYGNLLVNRGDDAAPKMFKRTSSTSSCPPLFLPYRNTKSFPLCHLKHNRFVHSPFNIVHIGAGGVVWLVACTRRHGAEPTSFLTAEPKTTLKCNMNRTNRSCIIYFVTSAPQHPDPRPHPHPPPPLWLPLIAFG